MTDTQPFFSVVVPNYNGSYYIEDAILSIIEQCFSSYELIVIDGGSNDCSLEIIYKYIDKIDHLVSEKDLGQSDALNKGFAMSRGKYLLWINSDDIMLPLTLSNASAILANEDQPIHWLSANTIHFDSEGKIIKFCVGPKWNDFFVNRTGMYAYGPTTIFSRELYNKTNNFDIALKYCMDTDLWYKFKSAGYKFEKTEHFFWGFRIHENSKTAHTIISIPSEQYLDEVRFTQARYNIRIDNYAKALFKLYKMLNGCYLKALVFTLRYRGLSIKKFNKMSELKCLNQISKV